MKRKVGFMAVLSLLIVAGAVAAAGEVSIPRSLMANGGGTASNGAVTLSGSLGQSVVGLAQAGDYALSSGFLAPATTGPSRAAVWVPLVWRE